MEKAPVGRRAVILFTDGKDETKGYWLKMLPVLQGVRAPKPENAQTTENKFKKLGHNKLLELTIGIKATFFSHIIHSIMRGHPGNKLFWFTVGLAWAVYSIYSLEIKEE